MEDAIASILKSTIAEAVLQAFDQAGLIAAVESAKMPCHVCAPEAKMPPTGLTETPIIEGPSGWDPDALLTKTQLGDYLQVTGRTLERWLVERERGVEIGPPVVRFPGLRSYRYRVRDVWEWLGIEE